MKNIDNLTKREKTEYSKETKIKQNFENKMNERSNSYFNNKSKWNKQFKRIELKEKD